MVTLKIANLKGESEMIKLTGVDKIPKNTYLYLVSRSNGKTHKQDKFYEAISYTKTYKTFKEFYEDYAIKYFTYDYACKIWEIKGRVNENE